MTQPAATLKETSAAQKKMGKYLIEKVLGKGAMGVVYLGYDPDICRPVAIKTLRSEILTAEEGGDFLTRFKTEAQAVGRLMHQNIVAIYDFDLHHTPPYFVMEYCPGIELKKCLKKDGRIPIKEAANIIFQILDALAFSHRMGIVHRDIKPANIFVQDDGRVKLADFGIAHLDTSDLTRMGMILGTPSYMSPEQAQAQEIDSRSDLFSVAAVIYEMLTGRKAFKGDNPAATLHQVVHKKPTNMLEFDPDLPPGLDDVLQKALAKKASQRYDSAEAFKQALVEVLAGRPQSATVWPLMKMGLGGLTAMGFVLIIGFFIKTGNLDPQLLSSASIHEGPISTDAYPYNIIPAGDASVAEFEINAQERRRIDRLLEIASAHFMVNRLISPEGSNAYDTYLLVLGREPGNRAAIEGLIKVAQAYVDQCDALLREGFVEDVIRRLDAGRDFFPNYPPIIERLEKMQMRNSVNL